MTLMIDGVGSPPFSAVTIPPIEAPPTVYREEVIAASRTQFSTPRAGVENAIAEQLNESLVSEAPVDARMKRAQYGAPGAARKAPSTAAMEKVLANQGTEVAGPSPVQARPAFTPRPQPQREFQPRPIPRPEQAASQRSSGLAVQPAAGGARPFAPRPVPVAQPSRDFVPQTKSAEDLKSILRTMTAQVGKEKEQKQSSQQSSLKQALAATLAKNPPARPAVSPAPLPTQKSTMPPTPVASAPPMAEKKPFEVPHDVLQKVLKGES